MTDVERRRIIQRLIKKLSAKEFSSVNEDYVTTAVKLTGLHPKVLKLLETSEVYETKLEAVDRSVIYEKLVHFYTVKNKIPCTHELFSSLYDEIPSFVDIGNFRKILVKMDFVWKKASQNTAVVIENPLVRFERYNYLKKIQFYRTSGSDIYYIDSGSYDSDGHFRDGKLSKKYAISNSDKVHKVVYALGPEGIQALEDIKAFSNDVIVEWVRDALLPKIKKRGVFVLKNWKHHNDKLLETPTVDSLKSDIVRWLDRHNVTYDPKMSKYELFALAEKYTDLQTDLFKIDELVKVHGHAILRIPKCIENVTSAALLYRIINENFPEIVKESRLNSEESAEERKVLFEELIMSAATTYIDEFERFITNKEADLVAMEDKVDKVYDTLMAKTSNLKLRDEYIDSDLPSCTDSE